MFSSLFKGSVITSNAIFDNSNTAMLCCIAKFNVCTDETDVLTLIGNCMHP